MYLRSLLALTLPAIVAASPPGYSGDGYSRDGYSRGSGSDSRGDCPQEYGDGIPPPPAHEPIEITELPLPPVTTSTANGSCDSTINPHGTGCIGVTTGLIAGTFLPDGNHIVAAVNFVGAPVAPDPASIYNGTQVILIKTDGGLFSTGDPWKCITCGLPEGHAVGANSTSIDYSYPQAFEDGKRILVGRYIVECDEDLTSDECTLDVTNIYIVRLDNQADGSGPGAMIRELRIHPDNEHIGVNSFGLTTSGSLSQVSYIGRLSFNPDPTTGTPLAARYDMVNVNVLLDPNSPQPLATNGSQMYLNPNALAVGEFRGFTGPGDEVLYLGSPVESCNFDVFAAHVQTGRVRRLTSHPGYVDPVQSSPDGEWLIIQDTRGSGRTEFMDGLRWLPPVTDLVTNLACSSVRNNGYRRFFQPVLLDKYGDRGDYYGQIVNNGTTGTYGSGAIDDPQWNGQADPWFSPDGTRIVYFQRQAVSPACGGTNPLLCYNSTEPGGRDSRVMIAHLISREPSPRPDIEELSDNIPWATPYQPGGELPARPFPREGNYTLIGKASGHADVAIYENEAKTGVQRVVINLYDYSDDGKGKINGYQDITAVVQAVVTTNLDWYANLTRSGQDSAVQITSPGGFHMSIGVLTNFFTANGTLTTTVGDVTYRQPVNRG